MSKHLRTESQNTLEVPLAPNIEMQVPFGGPLGGKPERGAHQMVVRGEEYEEGGPFVGLRLKWGLLWVFVGFWCVNKGMRIWNKARSRSERDKSVTDVTVAA